MEVVMNGVSFNRDLCSKMTKKHFLEAHEKSCFLDRNIEDRRIILTDVYSIIKGKSVANEGLY